MYRQAHPQSRLPSRRPRAVVRILAAAAGAVVLLGPAGAEPGPEARAEIDHLLSFILESSCTFVRNGREYGSERAYRHVLRKFDYFEARVETAEDFVEYSATRSTRSGLEYQFVCDGTARPSADVLLEELERFRRSRA